MTFALPHILYNQFKPSGCGSFQYDIGKVRFVNYDYWLKHTYPPYQVYLPAGADQWVDTVHPTDRPNEFFATDWHKLWNDLVGVLYIEISRFRQWPASRAPELGCTGLLCLEDETDAMVITSYIKHSPNGLISVANLLGFGMAPNPSDPWLAKMLDPH